MSLLNVALAPLLTARKVRRLDIPSTLRVVEEKRDGRHVEVPGRSVGRPARLKKKSQDLRPNRLNDLGSQGWEAVGLTLKRGGDLVAWRVVLLKRRKPRP